MAAEKVDAKGLMIASTGTQFTPLTDFFSEQVGSQYIEGLSYSVREGNDVLAGLVPVWVKEGKVRIGSVGCKVEGQG